jgi:uncharacterized RDD family membrane protein YckC
MATKKYCSYCDSKVHGNSKTCPNCESTVFMYQDEELHSTKAKSREAKESSKKISYSASTEPSDSAGLVKRFGAAVLDVLIGSPFALALFFVLPGTVYNEFVLRLIYIAPIVAIKSYSQITHGQSIGQKVFRIGLERHWTLSASQIILRNFVAFGLVIIPGLNLLNILVIGFNKNGKGLHDQLTGTRIIK